jgi:hypothetical protein
MRFKLLIILFFVNSCTSNYTKLENKKPFNSKGFAYIYNNEDYETKILQNKLNNELLQISHNILRTGALIKIINPKTQENLILKNVKKSKYPDFYKILITKSVAEKLNIDRNFPLVEILEIKKNKSFIAEKAKIYQEEKKISSKAPVTSVQIANISKKKLINKKDSKEDVYILIASFYTNEAAILLKQRIINESPSYNNKILKIKKRNSKKFEVLSGPYMSVNLLKNDYIELKKIGFEELDVTIND